MLPSRCSFLRVQRGAGVFLNKLSKFWRILGISRPSGWLPHRPKLKHPTAPKKSEATWNFVARNQRARTMGLVHDKHFRCADFSPTNRGDAATATWTFRGRIAAMPRPARASGTASTRPRRPRSSRSAAARSRTGAEVAATPRADCDAVRGSQRRRGRILATPRVDLSDASRRRSTSAPRLRTWPPSRPSLRRSETFWASARISSRSSTTRTTARRSSSICAATYAKWRRRAPRRRARRSRSTSAPRRAVPDPSVDAGLEF